jgi:hypothetical protein
MGKISQGILGGFSGKVGNIIGGNWKGIDYMRVKAASVKNPQTDGQVGQRSKFTTVLQLLQPLTGFIKIGFQNYAVKMTEFNSAMSYILQNAVSGEYPDIVIDYDKVLVSRGSLAAALNPTATSPAAGKVQFNWADNSTEGNASPTDKAMLLVYNPTLGEATFVVDGAVRTAGTQTLTIPNGYSGDTVHAFINAEGTEVSNSRHIGTIVVAA